MSATATHPEVDGIPVEIGRIDRELGRLWEESGDSKTRASLINLVIYSEDPSAVQENTRLIARVAGDHACRAILVTAEPGSKESAARAWISAHCHLVGKSGAQICSEQITFHLQGEASGSLPNIVFSHLDSDLPLIFWWKPPLPKQVDEKLWRWVDRLIFDSAAWPDPAGSLDQVRKIGNCRGPEAGFARRTILCDLNWTRLLGARFAFASIFDHDLALRQLHKIERLHLCHAPGSRTSALLFLGWLAVQLRWNLQPMLSSHLFVNPAGREVTFTLEEGQAGCDLQLCRMEANGINFEMARSPEASPYYELKMEGPGIPLHTRVVHAERQGDAESLLAELGRGGSHPLYFRALDRIRPLL